MRLGLFEYVVSGNIITVQNSTAIVALWGKVLYIHTVLSCISEETLWGQVIQAVNSTAYMQTR